MACTTATTRRRWIKVKRNPPLAKTNRSDFDIAFELQIREAIAASTLSSSAGRDLLGFTDNFFLYFKGLVLEDRDRKGKLGSIGVAIFDFNKALVFKVAKPLILPEAMMTDVVAELEALVQGLEFALSLEIGNVMFSYTDYLYPYLYENQKQNDAKVSELVDRLALLRKRFQNCHSFVATKENADLVLESAKSSIAKQAGKPFEKIMILTRENCTICLEDVDTKKMLEIRGCHHRFCSSCIQTHIELKVRDRKLPQCPQLNCGLKLDTDICKKLLTREMYNIMAQLIKESSIPTAEKVYCPDPKCSNLMSKTEVLGNNRNLASCSSWWFESTAGQCVKCHLRFCINCRVPWERHTGMSCDVYKKNQLYWNPSSSDVKFDALVGEKKWRPCPKCSHMVELVQGCNHISCRCGNEFCYVCGREWKNKKAMCTCPLWAEENIILHRGANRR